MCKRAPSGRKKSRAWDHFNKLWMMKVIKRFKYCFGPQPLAFVLNWSSIFQSRVKIVLAVKCWMENADMANFNFKNV
jgi:hypothetical protein